MPIKMSTPQNRQPPSQEEHLEAIQRLLQQQAESNRRSAESESSADMPQSTFSQRPPQVASGSGSGGSGGGSTPPLLSSNDKPDESKPVDVRVVEQHPSENAQPVKVLADLTTNSIVESVEHLEEETKVGFLGLILAFQQVYDSIKNLGATLGTRVTPGVAGQVPSGIKQPQRTSDPARPSTSGEKPYTRQADKYEPYSGQVFHERVADAMSTESIGVRLREAVFDRDGIIGGYAHRMFERRDSGKRYADRKIRESDARKEAIEEAALKLKDEGKSKAEVAKFRKKEIEQATKEGIITDLSKSELRKRGEDINDLRQRASKLVGIMEDRRNRGERPESINRSVEARELKEINAKIGEKDANEAFIQNEWEENRKKKRQGEPTSSTTPVPETDTPVEPEIGSKEKPYPWEPREPEASSIPASESSSAIKTSGSSPTSHSAEESKEEASLANQELIGFFRDIKTNTDSIPPIYNLLNEKFGNKDGETDSPSPEPDAPTSGGILDTIKDAASVFTGKGSPSGKSGTSILKSLKNLSFGKKLALAGTVAGGAYSIYDAFTSDVSEEGGGLESMALAGSAAVGAYDIFSGYRELGGTLPNVADNVDNAKNLAQMVGRNAKGLTSVGAGLFGAYDAVSEMQATNEALAAGEITQDQATVNNASSIGGGVGMAFGAGFGGAVGSVLGPLGTAGGAWLGGKIGNAVGEVGGEIVGTALNWFSDDAEAATPETLSKEKQTISMHGTLEALKPRPFAPIEKMESGLIKPMTPAPPQISNNPVIAVDARSSSTQTTQVNNWGPSNTDPTFLKYGASRYS